MEDTKVDPMDLLMDLYSEGEKDKLLKSLEITLLHNYKQNFKESPGAETNINYGGIPVTHDGGSFDIKAFLKSVADMYYRELQERVTPHEYYRIKGFGELK